MNLTEKINKKIPCDDGSNKNIRCIHCFDFSELKQKQKTLFKKDQKEGTGWKFK